MARDEAMHQRLQAWAAWLVVGDGSGYPVMSVLHADWSPPSPGLTPTLKSSRVPVEVRQTHRIVLGMSDRTRVTLLLVYGFPSLTQAERASRLGIAERTVAERVEAAQAALRQALGEFRHMQTFG
jgi:DNA-directed RNA polymerase specialized sigma24 family protein